MTDTDIRRALLTEAQRYPAWQIRDLFKYLYQSTHGCEHMVPSEEEAAIRILAEHKEAPPLDAPLVAPLGGAFCRVSLAYLDRGLSARTLAALFARSAKEETEGRAALERCLRIAMTLAEEGLLGFTPSALSAACERWRAEGYPAVRHSDAYRASYHPSYRVIARRYVPFLPLLARLDAALATGRVILAIEGGSAGGKSTLAALLGELYGAAVFHMDDFFLRPEQRTAARYAEVGGNIDRERFLSEVIAPLTRGEEVIYRRFDCGSLTLAPPTAVAPGALTVVEGAYSLHPSFGEYYDLAVFLDVAPDVQRARIERRNGPAMAERFHREWIPMEHRYFEGMRIPERCALRIPVTE